MIDDQTPDDQPPVPEDPFLAADPEARERERRRRERQARRAEREARQARGGATGPEMPDPGSTGRQPKEAKASKGPQGPSIAQKAGAALSGLGERIAERRAARVEQRQERDDDPERSLPPLEERPYREPGPTRESRQQGRFGTLRPTHLVAGLGLVVAVAALIFLYALFQPFHGGADGSVVIEVPQGATAGEVAELLDERGVISSAALFEIRLTLAGRRGDIFAGTYALQNGMSYSEVIDQLSSPPSERTIAITVPEGHSREQIAKLATDAGLSGSYERASRSSDQLNLSKYGAQGAESLEGFLFPATYELEAKASAKDLVSEQIKAFKKAFRKVDLDFARSRNLSPYDILIIASMIDREVMVAKERKIVASVIYNRLETGEPLGIDATIRYATGNYDQPLKQSELEIDSPYNTRTNAGLPPTPIGNPGPKAIRAAAKPADTDFRYYVVKPGTCGEHEFVETQEEFDAAVARYNEAREAAGGKSPTEC